MMLLLLLRCPRVFEISQKLANQCVPLAQALFNYKQALPALSNQQATKKHWSQSVRQPHLSRAKFSRIMQLLIMSHNLSPCNHRISLGLCLLHHPMGPGKPLRQLWTYHAWWKIVILLFVGGILRGKVKSQGANKLQRPFLANSIYCSDPISKMLKTATRLK